MRKAMMPFEYLVKSSVPPGPLEGKHPWYKMLTNRYATVRNYWKGDHEEQLRLHLVQNPNNSSWPREQGDLTRAQIVMFYEGITEFLLAHVADQSEALATVTENLNRAKRASEQATAANNSLYDRHQASEEEVRALRWAIMSLHKSSPEDPRLDPL